MMSSPEKKKKLSTRIPPAASPKKVPFMYLTLILFGCM